MKTSTDLFGLLRVSRDKVMSDLKKAEAIRTASEKVLNDIRADSPLYKQKKAETEKAYSEMVESTLNSGFTEVLDAIEGQRNVLQLKVTTDAKGLNDETLKGLKGIPVTATEFELLAKTFSLKNNYWIDKQLALLASENGLEYSANSDLESRFAVLDEVEQRINDFKDSYTKLADKRTVGEDRDRAEFKNLDSLHDSRLTKLEQRYLTKAQENRLSPEDRARFAIDSALSKPDAMSKAIFIANVFNGSDLATKNALLDALNASEKIDGYIVSLTRLQPNLEQRKIYHKTADEALSVLKKADDEGKLSGAYIARTLDYFGLMDDAEIRKTIAQAYPKEEVEIAFSQGMIEQLAREKANEQEYQKGIEDGSIKMAYGVRP